MNVKQIVAAAIAGFISAVVIDIHAWSQSNAEPFDWTLAVKRWIAGAVSGLAAGLGANQIPGLPNQ